MNFENLKGLLGEAYHEGITAEEVNSFFAGKSFADLSTGQYVDKSKHDREIQALNETLAAKETALNAKLSDDEKKLVAEQAKDAEITKLKEMLLQNSMTSNKDLVANTLSNTKVLLEIKDDDTEYDAFLNNIVSDDRNKSHTIATYLAKLTKDAYEKGKKDATKDSMGDFGKSKSSGSQDNGGKKKESIGAQLANRNKQNNQTYDYFKRG